MKVDIVERLTINAQWLHRDGFDTSANNAIDAKAEILSLRQRVAELEKERDDWRDEALGSRIFIETLTAERDALKEDRDRWRTDCQTYCDAMHKREEAITSLQAERDAALKLQTEANVLLIEQARDNESLKLERDKATQYWQIAEGRCDALMKQARLWKFDASTQAMIVRECYQACTGSTGEPGDWNGALPVQAVVAERDALIKQRDELVKALEDAVSVAKDALDHWDQDRDMKVGKLLHALSGLVNGYDSRADAVHNAIASVKEKA